MFTKLLNKLFLYFNFDYFNGNFSSFPFSNLVFLFCFGRIKNLSNKLRLSMYRDIKT